MMIVGPFWREKPSSATSTVTYANCWLWIDGTGCIIAIQWDR